MTAAFEEQLALVSELQTIDLDLHNLRLTLEGLPTKIAELETAYSDVKGRLEACQAELAAVEKQRRTDEVELAASVEHLREREAKLYAIKTNREYQAALKEISEGKRLNREREDRILQAMEKIESLTKESTQLGQDFAEKEGAFRQAKAAVEQEEAAIRKQKQEERAKRPQLLERIEKDTLRKYDTVRRRYADALVGVADGICQGCSRRLPPQLFNEILRREHFKVCPNCQRLLHAVAAVPADEASEGSGGS